MRPTSKTEDVILHEAGRLFANNGFDGTSIRDIARAVGISNAALYHHFDDKNSIYERLVVDLIARLSAFIDTEVARHVGAADRLRAFMTAYGVFFERNTAACIASSQSFLVLERSPERERARDQRDRFEDLLRGILRDGVANGEFRDIDVAMMGRAVLSCLNWMHRWYSLDGPMRPIDVAESYADILMGGIVARQPQPPPLRRRKNPPRKSTAGKSSP